MSLTNFKITEAGTALSADAEAHGIKVTLSTYRLGSAVGYVPDGTDVDLRGTTLFTGAITAFSTSPDGALVATLILNPDVGPFAFGEIGIYTDTGVLFASASLPTLQYKYSSLSSSVNSTIRLNCYLKVAQGPAIFVLPSAAGAEVYYVSNWSQVVPRPSLPDPDAKVLVVAETASGGIQSTLYYSATDPTGWTLGHPWVAGTDAISIYAANSATVAFVLPGGTIRVWGPSNTAFGVWLVKCGSQYRQGVLTFPYATAVNGTVRTGALGYVTFTESVTTIMSGTIQLWTDTLMDFVEPIAAAAGSAHTVFSILMSNGPSTNISASEVVVVEGAGGRSHKITGFSKTINLSLTGVGGMDTGAAPALGFVSIYAIYNPTTDTSALLAQDTTSIIAPFIYGGGYLPPGYTHSWLLSIWKTNASRQFVPMQQFDRRMTYLDVESWYNGQSHGNVENLGVYLFSVHNDVYAGVGGGYTCYWAMPKNAIKASGMMNLGSEGSATGFGYGLSTYPNMAGQGYEGYASYHMGPWNDLAIWAYTQSLYFGVGIGSASVNTSYYLTSYEFGGPYNFYPYGILSV